MEQEPSDPSPQKAEIDKSKFKAMGAVIAKGKEARKESPKIREMSPEKESESDYSPRQKKSNKFSPAPVSRRRDYSPSSGRSGDFADADTVKRIEHKVGLLETRIKSVETMQVNAAGRREQRQQAQAARKDRK